jgi:hypothetical protein
MYPQYGATQVDELAVGASALAGVREQARDYDVPLDIAL